MNRAGVDSSKIVPITMNGRGSNLDITLSPISVGI
jgi:hypothetical protein